MNKEITMIMRPKPKIIIPNEKNLQAIWDNAKRTYRIPLTPWEKLLSIFTFYKELVHPIDYRIFYCKIINGKVFKIGRFVRDTFKKVNSFDELEKLNISKYIK